MHGALLLLGVFFSIPGHGTALRGNRYLTANVSHTLDSLLATNHYDKRIRPGFGGPPITISVNLAIKSMGPIEENDQSFGLDCYFRQHWYDTRLKFEKLPGLDEFSLSWLFLEKVWKPDTYFVNGKKSYLHRITVPNKFLRLRFDGFMTYSMRLTITASCPMYLRKFPLDAQKCPLILGSYGYPTSDLLYEWADSNALGLEPGVELAQFDLVNVTIEHEKIMKRGESEYSTLQANFWLKRHTGYFMLQVYVPMLIIVTCSWVSFWIDPDAVPARVTLGVTTVLSLTTMGFGGRAQLPKVSYWTALDWFVIICFTSVFSVMIEYAMVNFFDKVKKDLKKIIESRKEEEKKKEIKKDQGPGDDETAAKEQPVTLRARSVSLSVATAAEEQPCRRISIACDTRSSLTRQSIPPKPAPALYLDLDLTRGANMIRRLSTTVRDFVQISSLQQKITKSIQNLTKEEPPVPPKPVPKVIVSDEDDYADLDADLVDLEEQRDLVVDVEQDEWEADDADDAVDTADDSNIFSCLRKLKTPLEMWENLKFLPQEAEVLKLLEDTEPPDKFSSIDIQSRRSFPLVFLIALTIYLIAFAYYLTDDFPERSREILLHKH